MCLGCVMCFNLYKIKRNRNEKLHIYTRSRLEKQILTINNVEPRIIKLKYIKTLLKEFDSTKKTVQRLRLVYIKSVTLRRRNKFIQAI